MNMLLILGFIIGLVVIFIVAMGKTEKRMIRQHEERYSEFEKMLKSNEFNISKRVVLIDEVNEKRGLPFGFPCAVTPATGIWFDYENRKIAVLSHDNSEIVFSFGELMKHDLDIVTSVKMAGGATFTAIQKYSLRIVIKKNNGTKSIEIRFTPAELRENLPTFTMVKTCMDKAIDELDNIMSLQT